MQNKSRSRKESSRNSTYCRRCGEAFSRRTRPDLSHSTCQDSFAAAHSHLSEREIETDRLQFIFLSLLG